MAGQRIDIMDLRQLIQLKRQGLSNRRVAKSLGISRNTVNTYTQAFQGHGLSYEQLEALPQSQLIELFQPTGDKDLQRYQQLVGYFPTFKKELQKTGCTLQTLWQDYIDTHSDGYRYTQFVHYFNQWAGKTKASGILLHRAGEKLFIDFAGKTLEYVDRQSGEIVTCQVFVGLMPASQYTYVQACHTQQRDDLVDCLNACLHWMGGVPKAIVADNMKAAVSKAHKYAPVINKTLKDMALHYGCVIDATRPYHPQDKALVEGAIRLVYQRIFYPLSKQTFFSLKELNRAIISLLKQYNQQLFQNRQTTRARLFAELDQPLLAALPTGPYLLRHYKRAKVQKISHIFLSADKNYYSVPHRFVGCRVEVQYTSHMVEIFYNHQRIARHQRSYKAGRYTTVADHMPSTHRAYMDWNPDMFEQKAALIGPHTKEYITRLIGQYDYPEIGYKQAQGILSFARLYSAHRLEQACRRGSRHHWAAYRIIESILNNNLDLTEQTEPAVENRIPEHANIRGSGSYQ